MEPALGGLVPPYVTLRRPRIHSKSLETRASKRLCSRFYSHRPAPGEAPDLPPASPPRTPRAREPSPSDTPLPPAVKRGQPEHGALCSPGSKGPTPPCGSPLERETGRVLSVSLEDCLPGDRREIGWRRARRRLAARPAIVVGSGEPRSPRDLNSECLLPSLRPAVRQYSPVKEEGSRFSQADGEPMLDPCGLRERLDTPSPGPAPGLPLPVEGPSPSPESSPQSSAHREPPSPAPGRWAFSPLVRSVRSKLQTFAGIFLSPVRGRLPWPLPSPSAPAPASPAVKPSAPSPRGVDIRLKIAIAGEAPAPHRPLSRSFSCPPHPARRRLLIPPAARPLPAPPHSRFGPPRRHRRHTLGGAEPRREIADPPAPSPPALLCLRKEVFPHPGGGPSALPLSLHTSPSSPSPPPPSPPPHDEASSPRSRERGVGARGRSSLSRQLSASGDGASAATYQLSPTGLPSSAAGHQEAPCQPAGATPRKRSHLSGELGTAVSTPSSAKELGDSAGRRIGKVSRFRIRKTPVRNQNNLTPMGLPKPTRPNKKEFSLEEIYTNKNYKAPNEKRLFETIFEEPIQKNGLLVLTSQRRLKRAVDFQDSSVPRKRRSRLRTRQGARATGWNRSLRSGMKEPQLELLLKQRLAELDAAATGDDS